MKRFILSAVAVAILALCGVSTSQGQIINDPTKVPAPATGAPAGQANAQGKLSAQALEEVVKQIGKNVKSSDRKDDEGQVIGTYYSFEVKHNGMTIPLTVELRSNWIWMYCDLGSLQANVPAAALQRLLEVQVATGPTHFSFIRTSDGLTVRMVHRLDRNISSARLMSGFSEYVNDITSSRDAWKAVVK